MFHILLENTTVQNAFIFDDLQLFPKERNNINNHYLPLPLLNFLLLTL